MSHYIYVPQLLYPFIYQMYSTPSSDQIQSKFSGQTPPLQGRIPSALPQRCDVGASPVDCGLPQQQVHGATINPSIPLHHHCFTSKILGDNDWASFKFISPFILLFNKHLFNISYVIICFTSTGDIILSLSPRSWNPDYMIYKQCDQGQIIICQGSSYSFSCPKTKFRYRQGLSTVAGT